MESIEQVLSSVVFAEFWLRLLYLLGRFKGGLFPPFCGNIASTQSPNPALWISNTSNCSISTKLTQIESIFLIGQGYRMIVLYRILVFVHNKQALHVNLLDNFTQFLDQRRHMQRIALSLRHVPNHPLHHSILNSTLWIYEIDVVSEGELTFPEDGWLSNHSTS